MSNSRVSADSKLLKRARTGDADAFGILYDHYASEVFRFLFPQLPTRMDAEDVTADVFLRAWRSLPTYKEQGYPFSAFLYRIARNLVADYYRKNKKVVIQLSDMQGELRSEGSSIKDIFSSGEEHQRLYHSLSNLKDEYRTVLVLRFLNYLSIEEISKVMKRSEGAVRVLQHRALGALRKLIETNGKY